MSKTLKLQNLSKNSNLKGFGVSYKQQTFFQSNHSQNILDKL